jgi:hypothetical protein
LEESEEDVILKRDLNKLLQSDENLFEHFTSLYPDVYLSEKYLNIIKSIGKPKSLLLQLYYQVGILVRNMKYEIVSQKFVRHFLNLQYMEPNKDYYIRPEDMHTEIDEDGNSRNIVCY